MMGLGKPVPSREPHLVRALVVLQCLIINAAAVTSHPGVRKEERSVVSSLAQNRLLRSSRGVYETPREGVPTDASESAVAAAGGGLLGMFPSPPMVNNFMRDTELLESELRRVRAERRSDEESEKNGIARSRMVSASGMVLHAATKLRNRVVVVRSNPSEARSVLDLHAWYWKDLVIPTGAYLVCVTVILTIFFVIISSIPSPSRMLSREKKRGCVSTFFRTMYSLHTRTRITLFCILVVGWTLFMMMWWSHIIQPWVKQFVMIVFALMIVVSLIMLLIMELTEICKQHSRKAMQKFQKVEKYLEALQEVRKEAKEALQFWKRDDDSDSDSEDDDASDSEEEAARAKREKFKAETRKPPPRACC